MSNLRHVLVRSGLGLGMFLSSGLGIWAQITLNEQNKSVREVIKSIEKVSDYRFFYNDDLDGLDKRITITVNDADIDVVLAKIKKQANIAYTIKDNHQVVLSNVVKKHLSVQQVIPKVTGVVLDNNGVPIIGANVLVKGTTKGTITDTNGFFSLEIEEGATLEVSYIGYASRLIKVGDRKNLSITLEEDSKALNELVVIGYGTMKKKDLTGAVASVRMDDAPVATLSTVSHALAGKAAGLQVSTISAQPGGQSTFRIRGAASSDRAGNDPLIIIDGFPVNDVGNLTSGNKYSDGNKDNILGSINPNDIASIEVLKDASSTAIYGARAGNGVIIVTTKRGQTGAAKVSYSGSASVQDIAKSYEMLDASGFMQATNDYFRELWLHDNKIGIYGGVSPDDLSLPALVLPYTEAQIMNPPINTKSFALICHDPDAPKENGWYHWLVVNIPLSTTSIKQGEKFQNALETVTDFGSTGYNGACPPKGHGIHHYNFTIYALDVDKIDVKNNAKPKDVEAQVLAHTIAKSTITALYERK